MSHTPGPWGVVRAAEEGEAAVVVSQADGYEGVAVCELDCGSVERTNATANVLAAALDLLNVAQWALECHNASKVKLPEKWVAKASAAIAKAGGAA